MKKFRRFLIGLFHLLRTSEITTRMWSVRFPHDLALTDHAIIGIGVATGAGIYLRRNFPWTLKY